MAACADHARIWLGMQLLKRAWPAVQLPIQRLKPSAPAAPKKAAAAAAFAAKGGDASRKRARAAAGGTALLALFSFLVFMGPVPMWPGGSPTGGVPARLVRAGLGSSVPGCFGFAAPTHRLLVPCPLLM